MLKVTQLLVRVDSAIFKCPNIKIIHFQLGSLMYFLKPHPQHANTHTHTHTHAQTCTHIHTQIHPFYRPVSSSSPNNSVLLFKMLPAWQPSCLPCLSNLTHPRGLGSRLLFCHLPFSSQGFILFFEHLQHLEFSYNTP